MQLHKLQMIQNSAARLVTGTHRRDHITPVLFKLHWLPVRYRIEFKLLVLVYQAVHHLGPAYLTSLVTPYAPTRSLRSAAHRSLTIPRYNLERYGRRAFSVAGPSLWNNLPVTIREASTLTTLKSTSLVAKHTNPEMFFTARFFYGNVMYMVWGVRKCRMLICILWAICIIKLISIFN